MADLSVFKALTAADRKRMRDLLAGNPSEEAFLKEVVLYEKKSNSEKRPWCRPCAKREFNKKRNEVRQTLQRTLTNPNEQVSEDDMKINIDLEKYWYKGEFKQQGERIIKDTTHLRSQGRAPLMRFNDYKCPLGHGCSINVGEEQLKAAK